MCLLLVLAASSASAQVEAPPGAPEIPSYPNAELVTEVNISDQDLLSYLQMGMLAFGSSAKGAVGEIGGIVKALDLETLANAISGLKYVRMLQFKPAELVKPADVLSFYAENIGQGWNRILWDISQPGRAFMVLAQPGMNEVLGVAVMAEKAAKPEGKESGEAAEVPKLDQRIVVARTLGMFDIQKLASWAGKAIVKFSEIDKQQKEAAAKKPAAKSTPAKSAPAKPASAKPKTPAR